MKNQKFSELSKIENWIATSPNDTMGWTYKNLRDADNSWSCNCIRRTICSVIVVLENIPQTSDYPLDIPGD